MAYKIVDLRKKLPGSPVASQGAKVKNRGVVIHYNGDPDGTTGVVSGGKTPEQVYIADAHYHINKNWNTAADPAYTNGIQYHFGIWGDTVYILRNLMHVYGIVVTGKAKITHGNILITIMLPP